MKIHLLDHGFVRLVSYMQPVPEAIREFDSLEAKHYGEPIGYRRPKSWTGDLEIVRNARVSHDADWRTGNNVEHSKICVSLLPPMSNGEQRPCNCQPKSRNDAKLLLHMATERHTTPFEAMVFTFEVKAPIFIFRQWHRHRTWTYNEVSARYTELPDEYYVPKQEHIGTQDTKNKQSRNFLSGVDDYVERDRQERLIDTYRTEAGHAHQKYQSRLGEGIPRELARINLPLSTYSRMFATVDLHNLLHFVDLRTSLHAQWEIQEYGRALFTLASTVCPIACAAWLEVHKNMPGATALTLA